MASAKPVIHGKDHRPGHSDPIYTADDPMPIDLPYVRVLASTDSGLSGATTDEGGGGIMYRAFAWTISGGDISENGVTVSIASSLTPFTVSDDHILIEPTGTFLAHVTVRATFPTQALSRTARVWVPSPGIPPGYLGGGSKRYMAMGNTTDIIEEFSETFIFPSGGNESIQVFFLEDDADEDRDAGTLSSARDLELVVIKIAS